MKVKKKSYDCINIETAHGGSGSRKLYIDDNEFKMTGNDLWLVTYWK